MGPGLRDGGAGLDYSGMRVAHRTAGDTYELGSGKLHVHSRHSPNVLLMFYTYIRPSLWLSLFMDYSCHFLI